MPIKLHPRSAVHLGRWRCNEVVETHGLLVTEAAGKLRVRLAKQWQHARRAGLSVEVAIRFEKALGLSSDTMMRMQAAHDLARVRAREGAIEVERVAA